MLWQQIVLLVWLFLSAIATVILIGEPRKTITPQTAAGTIVVASILAWVVASI